MTDSEHAALSAQLARALGWPEVTDFDEPLGVWASDGTNNSGWFDYRDPSVALPVLEWLMREHGFEPWFFAITWYMSRHDHNSLYGRTLPEAIARAAIAVGEEGRKRVEMNEAREVLQP